MMHMTPLAERALSQSIEKWEAVASGAARHGACPLCAEFRRDGAECVGCPVYEKTGLVRCFGTPFDQFLENETPENARTFADWLKTLRNDYLLIVKTY
ncbi:MAG: hypothetical protein C4583_03310 [Anaerolineaceae bacterium]|nr:MAG: hypothetical protein C4583_03310 [Anaerolineaceae bacterium]